MHLDNRKVRENYGELSCERKTDYGRYLRKKMPVFIFERFGHIRDSYE